MGEVSKQVDALVEHLDARHTIANRLKDSDMAMIDEMRAGGMQMGDAYNLLTQHNHKSYEECSLCSVHTYTPAAYYVQLSHGSVICVWASETETQRTDERTSRVSWKHTQGK